MKVTTKRCYILNIKALGLVVSEKKIVSYFPIISLRLIMMPLGAWPIWATGTQLAGFMKGVTKH